MNFGQMLAVYLALMHTKGVYYTIRSNYNNGEMACI